MIEFQISWSSPKISTCDSWECCVPFLNGVLLHWPESWRHGLKQNINSPSLLIANLRGICHSAKLSNHHHNWPNHEYLPQVQTFSHILFQMQKKNLNNHALICKLFLLGISIKMLMHFHSCGLLKLLGLTCYCMNYKSKNDLLGHWNVWACSLLEWCFVL